MPRASRVELPGCPPFRAICCDTLGLIKVVEAEGKTGAPQVVSRWGRPDLQRGIRCVSLSSDAPILAVARKTQIVEIHDTASGLLHFELSVPHYSLDTPGRPSREGSDGICGIHLFRNRSPWGPALLTCTEYGDAALQRLPSLEEPLTPPCADMNLISKWNISQTGSVLCMSLDGREEYAVFGGKELDVNLWDIGKNSKLWSGKLPHRDNLGLISPAWVTAVDFLSKEDHRKIVVGTGHHQVRLYDIGAQRRPVLAFDYGESPIKTVAADPDGHSVYVGTGSGDLGSFDMRTGKLLGGFKGKCAGSIRCVVRHPVLPIIASCGLDRYLRIHSTRTRQLLGCLYLKQQLVSVVFDVEENFSTEASSLKPDSKVSEEPCPEHALQEDVIITKPDINRPSFLEKSKKVKKGTIEETAGPKNVEDGHSDRHLSKDKSQLQDKTLKLKRTVREHNEPKEVKKRKKKSGILI